VGGLRGEGRVKKVDAEMCSGSEAGSYLRPMDFVYHSTLGLRVIKKKKAEAPWRGDISSGYGLKTPGEEISPCRVRPLHL